jgi:hypothetical protein
MDSVLKTPQQVGVLSSLEIAGFRAFEQLSFSRLARVNLIVGKNNVGKSSVLEAVQLYADGGASGTIVDLLEQRDLLDYAASKKARDGLERLETALEQLYFRRADAYAKQIRVGPRTGGPVLTVERLMLDSASAPSLVEQQGIFGEEIFSPAAEPAIRVRMDDRRVINVPLSRFDASLRWRGWAEVAPVVSIDANGHSDSDPGELWDNVALTELEESVLDALRVIEPGLERLSFIADTEGYERIPVVKIAGHSRPVPLRNLGDGMNRLLILSLGLVNSRNGILLVDEVENGIHYSAQPQMWELVFRIAVRLNVQVFATTHSWDCIEAFQQVANADPAVEGMLHRLERRKDGRIRVVDISEEDLAIATRNEIEIR